VGHDALDHVEDLLLPLKKQAFHLFDPRKTLQKRRRGPQKRKRPELSVVRTLPAGGPLRMIHTRSDPLLRQRCNRHEIPALVLDRVIYREALDETHAV
jgi:hypothetical protein